MNQPLKVLLIEDEAWRYHNLLGFPIHLFWARNHHDVDELLRFGPFDLVLWVQGSAATPYLEKGEFTRHEVWDRLLRVFEGEFVGFALWFN